MVWKVIRYKGAWRVIFVCGKEMRDQYPVDLSLRVALDVSRLLNADLRSRSLFAELYSAIEAGKPALRKWKASTPD